MKKILLLFKTVMLFGCKKPHNIPYSYEEATIYSNDNK